MSDTREKAAKQLTYALAYAGGDDPESLGQAIAFTKGALSQLLAADTSGEARAISDKLIADSIEKRRSG